MRSGSSTIPLLGVSAPACGPNRQAGALVMGVERPRETLPRPSGDGSDREGYRAQRLPWRLDEVIRHGRVDPVALGRGPQSERRIEVRGRR